MINRSGTGVCYVYYVTCTIYVHRSFRINVPFFRCQGARLSQFSAKTTNQKGVFNLKEKNFDQSKMIIFVSTNQKV